MKHCTKRWQDWEERKNMMADLKPCPFCGGKAELLIVPGCFKQGLSSSGWIVKCVKGCCNQMPFMSDHDAVEAWNRRAKPKTAIDLHNKLIGSDSFRE